MDVIKFWLKVFKRHFAFCGGVSMVLNLLTALIFFDLSVFLQTFRLRYIIVGAIMLTSVVATVKTVQSLYMTKDGNHKTEIG